MLKLASGTVFAQVVSVAAAPILTRLYAPEAFGITALFLSITSILGVIACMRYEVPIMLPERDEDAAGLLGVSVGFAATVALIAIPLFWWGRGPLLEWLNSPGLGLYLWLIPPAIFLSGASLALNCWNTRTKRFGRLSASRVAGSLTITPLTLGLGFAGHATAGSMIGANIAGQGAVTTVLGWQTWRDDRALFLGSIRWRSMAEGIKRYRKFPLVDSWAGIMNVISGQLAPLMLASFFSPAIVGFYSLGYRLLSMPSALVGGAISQVFFQHAAAARNDGTLSRVAGNTFTRLLALGLFPLLLAMVTGKEMFTVVFGSQWAEAGVYAQILSPWILMNFVSAPMAAIFPVLEMQGNFLLFNTILLGSRIACLLIGGLMNRVVVSLVLFSITGAVLYCLFCLFILNKAGVTTKCVINGSLGPIAIAFAALSPVIIMKICGASPTALVIAGCITAVINYAILFFHDKELKKLLAGRTAGW